MPRLRNGILANYLTKNDSNRFVCNNDFCVDRVLHHHTGNMERHLRLLHPQIYARYAQQKHAWKQKHKLKKAAITETAATTTTQNLPKCINKNNKNFELAVVEFFTKCKQPLSLLEEQAFKCLAQPAFEAFGINIDKHCVLSLIKQFSKKIKRDIMNVLSANTMYTLKIHTLPLDGGKHTLMSVSVQYIRKRYVENKILAQKTLEIDYTSDYLKPIINDILHDYRIELQQILSISTNDDLKLIATINALNDDVVSILAEEAAIASKTIKKETNDANDCIEEWLEYSTSDYVTQKINILLGGVYILKVCVKKLFANTEVKCVLEKCRLFVKCSQKQNAKEPNNTALPDTENHISDSATNWISTYQMLKDLSTVFDITLMNVLLDMLKLINCANSKLADEKLCYSDLFIIIMNIIFDLEKIPDEENIVKCLLDALNGEKQKLLEIDLFNAAVYLDPRIRVCLDATQKTRAKQFITKLHERIVRLRSRDCDSAHSESNESLFMETTVTHSKSTTSINPSSTESFNDYLQNLDFETAPVTLSHLETDITLYERSPRLPLETNVIDFWYFQHNSLADIARLILATPCSANYIELLTVGPQFELSKEHYKLTAEELDHIARVELNGTFAYEQ